MKLLNLTSINQFNEEADYLVSLELSLKEKERIGEKYIRWKNAIDSAIAHVWVADGSVTGMDLSVFDSDGDWEDGIPVDTVFDHDISDKICEFVRDLLKQTEAGIQAKQTNQAWLRLEYNDAAIAGSYDELSVFTVDNTGEEVLIESEYELLDSMEKGNPLYIYSLHNELLQFIKEDTPFPFTKDEVTFLYQTILSSAISEKVDVKRQNELIFKLEFLMRHLGYEDEFDTQKITDTEHDMER